MLYRVIAIAGGLLAGAHLLDLDDRAHYAWKEWQTPESEQALSVWLPDYQVDTEAVKIPGTKHNASGITYCPDSDSFFVVINNPTQLLELNRQLELVRTIELEGFSDTEGVAYAGPGQLIIADERKQTVALANIDKGTRTLVKSELAQITLNTNGEGNKGFEGIAVDHENKTVYAVRERDPMRLLTIDGLLDAKRNISINDPLDLSRYSFDDLSGLHFDHHSGNLLVLSDESKLITEINAQGDTVSFMDLEAGFNGLSSSVPQAEGITMDDEGNLYIVSEPNLIYRYQRIDQG